MLRRVGELGFPTLELVAPGTWNVSHSWAHEKKIPENQNFQWNASWFNRDPDPYYGLLSLSQSPYKWVVFHPLYKLNDQIFFIALMNFCGGKAFGCVHFGWWMAIELVTIEKSRKTMNILASSSWCFRCYPFWNIFASQIGSSLLEITVFLYHVLFCIHGIQKFRIWKKTTEKTLRKQQVTAVFGDSTNHDLATRTLPIIPKTIRRPYVDEDTWTVLMVWIWTLRSGKTSPNQLGNNSQTIRNSAVVPDFHSKTLKVCDKLQLPETFFGQIGLYFAKLVNSGITHLDSYIPSIKGSVCCKSLTYLP